MDKHMHLRFRLWVFTGDTPYLGTGPIELLEKINKHGSIAKAAADMKMSYRKAWQLVQNMNTIADAPLVTTQLGGNKGGGAEVTEKGRQVIRQYHQLAQEMETFLQEKMKTLNW
jgi:molybdate transport system regulatory protein